MGETWSLTANLSIIAGYYYLILKLFNCELNAVFIETMGDNSSDTCPSETECQRPLDMHL